MQTFVPLPDMAASAAVLDDRRLGKMRLEGYQLLRTVLGETGGWASHPAARMWRECPAGLAAYSVACSREWVARDHPDELMGMVAEVCWRHGLPDEGDPADLPAWWGDPRVHASHRSNLLRKAPDHYGTLGWTEPDDLPYHWPVGRDGSYVDAGGRCWSPGSVGSRWASGGPSEDGDASRRGALRARREPSTEDAWATR